MDRFAEIWCPNELVPGGDMVPKRNGAHMTKWCPGDSVPKRNGTHFRNGAHTKWCPNEMVPIRDMVPERNGAHTKWCPFGRYGA